MENKHLFSVWNKVTKTLITLPAKETHVLNKEVCIIRHPHGIDLEGKTIYDGDYVLFINHDYLPLLNESCYIIEKGTPVNNFHSKVFSETKLWHDALVIGNIYEGIKVDEQLIAKYRKQFKNMKSIQIAEDKNTLDVQFSNQSDVGDNVCPECKAELQNTGGCKQCVNCGYSACSL